MTDTALLAAAPPREGAFFRAALGLVALVGGLLGLGGLYFVPIPSGNREPLLLALGLVLGWGSTVIGYEFGSSPAGRKAADAGIKTPTNGRQCMNLKSIFKTIVRAAPVIVAHAPAVIAALREVRRAARRSPPPDR